MKTPRDILLEKHAEAAPELDAIRERVVAGMRKPTAPSIVLGFVVNAWAQLFWRGRMAWGGIAAVWIALFFVRASALGEIELPEKKMAAEGRTMELARWIERKEQLRVELGLPVVSHTALPVRRKNPGPQSSSGWRDAVV